MKSLFQALLAWEGVKFVLTFLFWFAVLFGVWMFCNN